MDDTAIECRATNSYTRVTLQQLQGPASLGHLLGNVKTAVFLTQVHPLPAQAGLSSWPVGELLR